MQERLNETLEEMKKKLAELDKGDALKDVRTQYLGKKGKISAMMKQMGQLAPEERPSFGQKVNALRQEAEALIEKKRAEFEEAERLRRFEAETIDVTLPTIKNRLGGAHPITRGKREIIGIFTKMGFTVVEGPEIELDKYNFEMLNIPKDHPARDEQDTFYVTDDIVLRTHTSPVQVRTMLAKEPPIRMLCPGRVFRQDDVDATHSPVFNQIEGLVIDKNVTFADLKGTINAFLREFYGEDTKTKFRPGFFPFTEPSAEVDATCSLCHGEGCPACKGAGMIEVLGCGMVNPRVLENCGIDPEVYSGFAFGLGLDRLTNIKYGINDIRLLYENDIRFIKQFK